MSDYCSLFSQTFYGLLFSYLTTTDVTSYVHHKFLVSFLLYIATKTTCQINQIITVTYSNDLVNLTWMLLFSRLQKKITLARLAYLCLLDSTLTSKMQLMDTLWMWESFHFVMQSTRPCPDNYSSWPCSL